MIVSLLQAYDKLYLCRKKVFKIALMLVGNALFPNGCRDGDRSFPIIPVGEVSVIPLDASPLQAYVLALYAFSSFLVEGTMDSSQVPLVCTSHCRHQVSAPPESRNGLERHPQPYTINGRTVCAAIALQRKMRGWLLHKQGHGFLRLPLGTQR
jgi:hypothetical protein